MKKIFVLLMTAALLFPVCNVAAVINIKLAVVTKPGSAQNIVAGKFKELIEKRSHGDIRVKIFHSASLGNETEILQQVQMNSIQMAIITGGPFDTFDPMARVINYPFLFKNYEAVDRILDGPLGAELLKHLESSGFKGLCFSENGFRNLTNSKRPVKSVDDLKGLKIRVMNSAIHKAIWQSLGANPLDGVSAVRARFYHDPCGGRSGPVPLCVQLFPFLVRGAGALSPGLVVIPGRFGGLSPQGPPRHRYVASKNAGCSPEIFHHHGSPGISQPVFRHDFFRVPVCLFCAASDIPGPVSAQMDRLRHRPHQRFYFDDPLYSFSAEGLGPGTP